MKQAALENIPTVTPTSLDQNIVPRATTAQKLSFINLLALAALTASLLSLTVLCRQMADPAPIRCAGLSFDRLTTLLSLVVATIGAVTVRFSRGYLDGDPAQSSFSRWLAVTIAAAYLLMLADNLLLLVAAWSATSWGLHHLLTHYKERKGAWQVARKKFVFSRVGDLGLFASLYLVFVHWHTLSLATFKLDIEHCGTNRYVIELAWLLSIAAVTKSAQFPFHSWLPDTMEAPAPVSALMHAGIINGGGALLLKFAPLLIRVPSAMIGLSIVGSLTVAIGMLSMWNQTTIKTTLAWSTVAQMGFMMAECSAGAFAAAVLHISAHAYYKAYSFLRAGTLPASVKPPKPGLFSKELTAFVIGTILSGGSSIIASHIVPNSTDSKLAQIPLIAIWTLSIGQIWVAQARQNMLNNAGQVLLAMLLTIVAAFACLGVYDALTWYFQPIFVHTTMSQQSALLVSSCFPACTILMLCVADLFGSQRGESLSLRALKLHASNGFYFSVMADQLVDRLFRFPIAIGVNNA